MQQQTNRWQGWLVNWSLMSLLTEINLTVPIQ